MGDESRNGFASAAAAHAVPADADNGLSADSSLMVDKLTTMRREALRERLGRLDEELLLRLSRALVVVLGIA